MESSGTPSLLRRMGVIFWRLFWQISRYPTAFISTIIVLAYILIALVGPFIAPYDFDEIHRGEDRRALRNTPPSETFIMGTDSRGRDVFSRLLWGARDTIGLPAIAAGFSVVFGTIIGLASGYHGGWFDEIISRLMDSLLALPALVLALIMLATIVPILDHTQMIGIKQLVALFGANNISLTLVLVVLYVPIVTRVVRSATLTIRTSGYIEEARLRGESTWYIMFSEILPGVLPALIVEASLRLSYAIFLIASLGFLGLGVQPPSPEWGRMVLESRDFLNTAPWTVWFPVLAIASLIVSINLMSDGIRRILRYEVKRG